MKELIRFSRRLAATAGIIGAALLSGCQPYTFAPLPGETPVGKTGDPAGYQRPSGRSDALFIGDEVTVTFNSGESQQLLPPLVEAIKDDGKITPPPPVIGSVVAAGKTPGELQDELQKMYDVYYKNMVVTVTARNRYYSVSGEVKTPGTRPYLGATTVLGAITAAGDFTDFAKKSRVQIQHANGKKQTVNALEAINDPSKNVQIFPGDEIHVPRRWF